MRPFFLRKFRWYDTEDLQKWILQNNGMCVTGVVVADGFADGRVNASYIIHRVIYFVTGGIG